MVVREEMDASLWPGSAIIQWLDQMEVMEVMEATLLSK